MKHLLIGTSALACLLTGAQAQIALEVAGGAYIQDFDTLANSGSNAWTDNTTLPGWYAKAANTFGGNYTADAGSSIAGDVYSYGSAAAADRALGSLATSGRGPGTGSLAYGLRLQNNTGRFLTDFTVTYTGEQWRNAIINAQTLDFSYLIAPTITSPDVANANTWTDVDALDFTSPTFTPLRAPGVALDGNLPANRTIFSAVMLTGVVLNDGEELFIRWYDKLDPGSNHGLAIDDVTVVYAVPEPRTSALVVGLGLISFAAYRRRLAGNH